MRSLLRSPLVLSMMLVAAIAATTLLAGCPATVPTTAGAASAPAPTLAQQYTAAATVATTLVDQVTLAADAALKAGWLKGQDAKNVATILNTAHAGLVSANAVASGDPGTAIASVAALSAALSGAAAIITDAKPKPPAPATSGAST